MLALDRFLWRCPAPACEVVSTAPARATRLHGLMYGRCMLRFGEVDGHDPAVDRCRLQFHDSTDREGGTFDLSAPAPAAHSKFTP